MSDLIDREALLRQIDIDSEGEPGYYGDTWKFIDTIKNMPNVHDLPKDTDTISRQAAIDAFNTNLNELVVGGEENAKTVENYLNRVLDKIKYLPSALSTNLAEVGTDCISREQAIDAVRKSYDAILDFESDGHTVADSFEDIINALPSAQPDIIRCRNCKFASGDSRICMKFGHSPIGELDFCAWAERRTDG